MNRAVGFIVAAVIAGSACGDSRGAPALSRDQLLDRLRALPGVTDANDVRTISGTGTEDYSYYVLHFRQPIDHDDASQGFFDQQVSLLHRNEQAPTPMIVSTSGYADEYGDMPVELTQMLDANQVSIEHRFFGTSRPQPTDWTRLSIKQMADDEHAIIAALRSIYGGAFVTTGASKGGMTAVFHRRWYPDDVEGTVAYVAPISLNAPDPRYVAKLDLVASERCHSAVRALASEVLQRLPQMQAFAQDQADNDDVKHAYTRVAIGPATEAAVASLEWSFWQYSGVDFCSGLPLTSASDKDLFDFLNATSPVTEYDDKRVGLYEAYYYQMYAQLGYPANTASYLTPDLSYKETDYAGELPCSEPTYDKTAMDDIVNTVGGTVQNLAFIYGGWDPWTGGAFPSENFSQRYIVDQGTHKAQIVDLEPGDRDAALAYVQEWTGVTPVVGRLRRTSDARRGGRGAVGPDATRLPPPLSVRGAPR